MKVLSTLTALLLAASVAAAQEPAFEALGQAPVVAGDRVRARERALDEALRQAVEQATATVLEPDALVSRASDLKLRIYPKARSYVGTYRILDEGEQPSAAGGASSGVFQVHISAQVATGRLARDLAVGVSRTAPRPAAPDRPKAVVCVAVRAAARAPGASPSAAPPAAAPPPLIDRTVADLLTAHGVEPVDAGAACAESPEPAARSAMAARGAQGGVVGTIDVAPAGAIRGTDAVAAHARAAYRLLEADGRVSAEGSAERDGYADTQERADAGAAHAASGEAARALAPAILAKWGGQSAAGTVHVHLGSVGRYAEYAAVARALEGLPGVAGVEARRFGRTDADLLVHTASQAAQLAASLQRVSPPGMKLTIKATADLLSIDVVADPGYGERG